MLQKLFLELFVHLNIVVDALIIFGPIRPVEFQDNIRNGGKPHMVFYFVLCAIRLCVYPCFLSADIM